MWDHRAGQSPRSRRNAHHHHGNHRNVYPNLWRKREQELRRGTWENKTVKEAHSVWAPASGTHQHTWPLRAGCRQGLAGSSASHCPEEPRQPCQRKPKPGLAGSQKHACPARDLPERHEPRRWLGKASGRRRGLNWTLRYIMVAFLTLFQTEVLFTCNKILPF